jgi:hypothetical protein
MVATIAADSGRRKRRGNLLMGGLALVVTGVAGGLRGLLCTRSRGVPAVSVHNTLSAPVARWVGGQDPLAAEGGGCDVVVGMPARGPLVALPLS